MSIQRIIRGLLKTFMAIVLLLVLGLISMLLILRHEHNEQIVLPAPSGHFAVGRTSYRWVNDAESDDLAPPPAPKRQVMAWIWYPAAPSSAPPVEYLPAPWRSALDARSGVLMATYFTRDLSRVQAHSTSEPGVSPGQHSYPVVLMRAGGGAPTTDFTTLAEDLASHGYIVVGFDAPYRTIVFVSADGHVIQRPPSADPEGLDSAQANQLINKLLPMWTTDTKFVVDQLQKLNTADPSGKFTGRLDLEHLGIFGHSFGGATALQFCHDDIRCKAGIDIDGAPYGTVVEDGLKQPFMILLSDHSREVSDPESQRIGANIQSIYNRLPSGRWLLSIRGAQHFSFSDQVLQKNPLLTRLLALSGGIGKLDARRGLMITTTYVDTFFDVYLKGAPASELAAIAARYPEVKSEELHTSN